MSQCPYCDRELPGFETVCQKCFEAGYERIAHAKPWWKPRHRPRLSLNGLYALLFTFGFCFLDARFIWHDSTKIAALLALAAALAAVTLESISGDDESHTERKRARNKPGP